VLRNSIGYNESIEIPIIALAPYVGAKEFVLWYVCNSLDSDSRIVLLISSMLIFLGAIMLRCMKIHGISRMVLVIRIDGSD
jgi:hypothetical protein